MVNFGKMMHLVFITGLLRLLTPQVLAQEGPTITGEISPEIKRIGMTAYLNCTVARQGYNKVFWIQESSQTVLTSDDTVYVDDFINEIVDGKTKYDVQKLSQLDTATYTLIIRHLVLSDAGIYTCQINVKGSANPPKKEGVIVVQATPTIVRSETTETVHALEGGSATLTCNAVGHPTPNISWVRVNGRTLPPPYNRFTYRGNVLKLSNLRPEDRGIYRCIADNWVRPMATHDASVYVSFRPRARALKRSYGQAQFRGYDITIECVVAGYPLSEIKWYFKAYDGLHPVINDDKHTINRMMAYGQILSIAEVWSQMTIISVLAPDYGFYICEGTNKFGTDRSEILVYETSECQGANCPPQNVLNDSSEAP